MSHQDFRKRLDAIGATAQTRSAPKAAAVRPRAGIGHHAFGLAWGTGLGAAMVYLNQSYDALFRGTDPAPLWALLGVAFFVISVLAMAAMLLASLLMLLMGRGFGRVWAVLGSVFLGLGVGAFLIRFALAEGL